MHLPPKTKAGHNSVGYRIVALNFSTPPLETSLDSCHAVSLNRIKVTTEVLP